LVVQNNLIKYNIYINIINIDYLIKILQNIAQEIKRHANLNVQLQHFIIY